MSVKTHQSVSSDMRNYSKINPKEVDANIKSSDVIVPTDSQSRLASTIQTHNGAVVSPNGGTSYGNYASSWIDCDGFDKVAVKAYSGSALSWEILFYWSDDANAVVGSESSGANANNYKILRADVSGRYLRVGLINRDATTPQTMNGSAYLKV